MAPGHVDARPELPHQHDLVAQRIVGKDARVTAALEHLAVHHDVGPATEGRMPEMVFADAIVSLENHLVLEQLSVFVHGHRFPIAADQLSWTRPLTLVTATMPTNHRTNVQLKK
jgi:hypothetical protein